MLLAGPCHLRFRAQWEAAVIANYVPPAAAGARDLAAAFQPNAAVAHPPDQFARHAGDKSAGRNITVNHLTGSNERIFTDGYPGKILPLP